MTGQVTDFELSAELAELQAIGARLRRCRTAAARRGVGSQRRVPRGGGAEGCELGLLRSRLRARTVGLGAGQPRELPDSRGAQRRVCVDGRHGLGAQLAVVFAAGEVGQRRAEAAVLSEARLLASGSERTACRRPVRVRMRQRSCAKRSATATSGFSTAPSSGSRLAARPGSTSCSRALGEDRVKGISAFLVERSRIRASAFGKKERKLGIKASPTTEILLDNVRVPAANLLCEEGEGFTVALDTLDGGRLGIASQALGIARSSRDLIRDYLATQVDAKGRPTSPQSAQWQLADITAELDAYRFLTWRERQRFATPR